MPAELDPAVVGVVQAFRSAGVMVEVLEPYCPTCGESWHDPGVTVKCRDWHEICNQCLAPYDQPKEQGCRRRKHPKLVEP